MKTREWLVAVVVVVVLLFSVTVLRWRYDQAVMGGLPTQVRTDRFTGQVQRLTPRGWAPMSQEPENNGRLSDRTLRLLDGSPAPQR